MRAIAVSAFRAEPGLIELPKPDPGPGDVRVKIEYAALNPRDWQTADGTLDGIVEPVFPLVIGVDFAGRVDMIGSGDNRFRVGDPVLGHVTARSFGRGTWRGTYCEFVSVPHDSPIVLVPDGLPLLTAAALPAAGMAAAQILDSATAAGARSLLIVGAAGGVGSCLTQLASARGLQVLAAVRGDEQRRMGTLGAAVTVDTTTGPEALEAAARDVCPDGVDVLVDLASTGPAAFAAHVGLVRDGGIALSTRGAAVSTRGATPGALGTDAPSGVGETNFRLAPTSALLGVLAVRAARGRLSIPIDIELPLEKAPQALDRNRTGGARGKTVFAL